LWWSVLKWKSYDYYRLPKKLYPKTVLIYPEDKNSVFQKIKEAEIIYPCIVKPDTGRMWRDVKKIYNDREILHYQNKISEPFLVQEFIDYPLEFGVFYCRLPNSDKWEITGIVEKKFMFLEWDGVSTFEKLILKHPRAKYYYNQMKKEHKPSWNKVLAKGDLFQLNYVWNHCKWSTFYDVSYLKTPSLEIFFDDLSKKFDWFYFGRYDLKAKTIEDFLTWNIQIIEINWVGSLPTFVYDPKHSLRYAYSQFFKHLNLMYQISKINRKIWYQYSSLRVFLQAIRKYGI